MMMKKNLPLNSILPQKPKNISSKILKKEDEELNERDTNFQISNKDKKIIGGGGVGKDK